MHNERKNMTCLEKAKFDSNGLLTAIVQDHKTGKVLMCAFMNAETLKMTLETKKMTYWSRSRKKIWLKGEESGNFQFVKEVRFDCDGDAALFKVEQKGGACHEGWESCFAYKAGDDGVLITDETRLFDPADVYKKKS
ncbi:MAG: phosphoribosyl-AMP cyclohydrolase [Fibrobacterota bacterium]